VLKEILDWWQYNFWLGLAGVVVGLVAISPLLLSKRFRKWLSRSSLDLEGLGLTIILVAILLVGLYNWFFASGGVN
jgi:hypothetical protein